MRHLSLGVAVLAAAAVALAPSAASAASWSALSPVDPSGAYTSQLDGIACTSSTNCETVGRTDDTTTPRALIELYSSGRFTAQTPATPPVGTVGSGLNGVGCSAAAACTAVGDYDDGSATWALVERWNGSAWSLQTFPRPSGALASRLSGVSCVTSTFCVAVGTYTDRNNISQPLAGVYTGTWALSTVPTVAGATGTGLSSVHCSSTTACMTVGTYLDASTPAVPLPTSASYSSGTWTLRSVPTPTGALSTFLNSVSCTSSSACTTVGYSTNVSGIFAVAERWNGTTWSQQTLAAAPAGATGDGLLGVSCTSSTHCSAVGYYLDSLGVQTTVAQLWNGTRWTGETPPNPAGFGLASVSGVACTTSTACISVGYWWDSLFTHQAPLAHRYS